MTITQLVFSANINWICILGLNADESINFAPELEVCIPSFNLNLESHPDTLAGSIVFFYHVIFN